jgi:MSHA type pilus biogenesis protein MshL
MHPLLTVLLCAIPMAGCYPKLQPQLHSDIENRLLAPDQLFLQEQDSTSGLVRLASSASSNLEANDWQSVKQLRQRKPSQPSTVPEVLQQTVSIEAVSLPLHTLLDSVAEQIGVSWEASEYLSIPVDWTLPQQPTHRILDRLARRYNLAWEYTGGVLSVRGPSSYSATYPVNYLNGSRTFQSRVGLATEVGTMRGVGQATLSNAANSSSTTIENVSSQAFWQSLATDIEFWLTDVQGEVRWSINQDTGLISLHGPPNAHKDVQQYLKAVAATSNRQVLIEASVVEVQLSDEFEAGIDWQWVAQNLNGVSALQQLHGLGPLNADNLNAYSTPNGMMTFSQSLEQGDFSATVQLLQQFGEARVVSRPQILAMNNQPAVLKVVDNRVYFTLSVDRQQTADSSERSTQTQIHTVPVGLVMNVLPQISEDNSVMLNIRPSLSRILGFVNDPNPDLNAAQVRNGVPEIQVREMESVLRVPSGSVAVIGGLMQSSQDDRDRQIPGLGDLPGVGRLFGQQKRQQRRTELFIVIKPTVLSAMEKAAS